VQLIKLNAIDSTNSYLKELVRTSKVQNNTVVVSQEQIKGRGQRNASWKSIPNESLTFSVYRTCKGLDISNQFYLAIAVSLAIFKVLNSFKVSGIKIKWPNDIMSYQKKLCGILIENVWTKGHLSYTIIGIGLNVNEQNFNDLPIATSLFLETKKMFDLNEILKCIVNEIETQFALLEAQNYNKLHQEYEAVLFRKEMVSTFKNNEGKQFQGIITGVSPSGLLNVKLENDVQKQYNLKEISLLLN